MEKLIVISSEDKDPSSVSNSDFVVTFNDSFTQQVSKVLVREVMVPNCFYNIRGESKYGRPNNVLRFRQLDLGQAWISIIIPTGQYNVTEFIKILQSKTESILVSATVSIELQEHTDVLKFVFSGIHKDVEFDGTSSMSDVIGFTKNMVANENNENTITIPYSPDLSGLNQVMIHSEEVAETHGLDAGKKGYINLLETVSLHNVEFGSWGYKQNNDDELAEILYNDSKNLSRIRIVLRDNEGNRLDIGTKKMSVVLKAYFTQ